LRLTAARAQHWVWPAGETLSIVRMLRMARIFRVLKAGGYVKNLPGLLTQGDQGGRPAPLAWQFLRDLSHLALVFLPTPPPPPYIL
jgi:hypothetical protein